MVQRVRLALNIASTDQLSVAFNASSNIDANNFCPDIQSGESCVDVRMNVFNTSGLTPFDIETRAILQNAAFVLTASDTGPSALFTVQSGFGFPTVSVTDFTKNTSNDGFSAWEQRLYPQNAWEPLSTPCVSGVACANVPVAPSMRYEHSSIIYQSWTLSDVLKHQSFCNIGTNNSMCTESCLVDVSCLRPSTLAQSAAWNLMTFYAQTIDATFWLSAFDFIGDDNSIDLTEPTTTLASSCPGKCCGNRRRCMRTHDNLGKVVPFNRSYMLVFGGRTRKIQLVYNSVTNEDEELYLHCESILGNLTSNDPSYAQLSACSEIQSDELWRYDTIANTWELIKPNTDEVIPPSGGSTADLYPYGRYGHASAFVDIPASRDPQGYRRKYMFIFGGVSNKCLNGLCSDLWRYDIPWAAESFWPINGATNLAGYNRGNRWKKLSPCPFGGRFRHSMIASEDGGILYSFGGQKDFSWDQQLLVYKLATDTWELVNPAGYRYFTRSYVDYGGKKVATNYTDFSTFDPKTDTLGDLGFLSLLGNYLDYQPQFPTQRGDLCMVGYTGTVVVNSTANRTSARVVVMTGFRTYDSPYPKLDSSQIPYPTLPYYLDSKDMWQYDEISGIWTQIFVGEHMGHAGQDAAPLPRRGSSAVVLTDSTPDEYIGVFGGYRGDALYGDFWLLKNYKDNDFRNREWIRIDDKIPTGFSGRIRPGNVTYHSMNFDPVTGRIFLFGGLNWTSTNFTESDSQSDSDRRCFLSARSIIKTTCTDAPNNAACALQQAKETILQLCEATVSTSNSTTKTDAFCCESVPKFPFVNRLSDLSQLCTTECQDNSFQYEVSLGFGEGVWVLDPNACENSCMGKGRCKWGRCLCEPGRTGSDCSVPTCPGSFCYYSQHTFETTCNACSGNGECGSNGVCGCNAGWTGLDCGAVECLNNCTGNQFCLGDFPVNQCICDPRRSGRACETRLCLNNCSMAGNCTSNGTCVCTENFFGDDCSVYIPTLSGIRERVEWIVGLVVLVTVFT